MIEARVPREMVARAKCTWTLLYTYMSSQLLMHKLNFASSHSTSFEQCTLDRIRPGKGHLLMDADGPQACPPPFVTFKEMWQL